MLKKYRRLAALFWLGCVPLLRAQIPAPQPLCGRLSEDQGLTVLELWGTPEQAGYAHGFLMADKIVRLFDDFVLSPVMIESPQVYETFFIPGARRVFAWTEAQERELRALCAGVRDKLGAENVRSKKLGRELKLEDLLVVNALADWKGLLCSSFSVWGPLTADGQTLTARNLDYPAAGGMERAQFILVYRGDGQSIPWVGVTWPGLIGIYTAMNRDGVTMTIHDAHGLPASYTDEFTPRPLALRAALEAARPDTFVEDVQRVLRQRHILVGTNTHVSAPFAANRPPAAIFEYDANKRDGGVTVRLANTMPPAAAPPAMLDFLCCTNHLRARCGPLECKRYDKLVKTLAEYAQAGKKLDPAAAMKLIQSVRQRTTLHSVCFAPARKTMYVHIPALNADMVELKLDKWLKPSVSPAAADKPAEAKKP